jgi:creatinine amidohydrolase/Fe(II)-dependent formamide hydrolase-like protein
MPYLTELPWREAEAYFKRDDRVAFGVGAIHAHDHIPAGIDTITTDYFLREIEQRAGILVLPSIPFGPMDNYMDYPGCISPSIETFTRMVSEVVHDLHKWGARKIFAINGHGGNTAPLLDVSFQMRQLDALMPVLEWWRLMQGINPKLDKAVNALPESAQAGRKARTRGIETAVAMALLPDAMQPDSIRVVYAREQFRDGQLATNFATGISFRGVVVPAAFGSRETTDWGEVGTCATPEMGHQLLAEAVDFMVGFIEALGQQAVPAYRTD